MPAEKSALAVGRDYERGGWERCSEAWEIGCLPGKPVVTGSRL